MRLLYKEKAFSESTLQVIAMANRIIAEYDEQGFTLTLRQLYYQFVARDIIPNTERSYKRLGSIVNDGRLAGMIDWEAIEDRTRWLRSLSHWDSPASIVGACAKQFRVDLWEDQPRRIEVWIEKDALVGVIERVCEEYDVPYFACRGYVSQSEQWGAGMRAARHLRNGQDPLIIHLGDHDPSGVDMSRDIGDRMDLFAGQYIEVRRVALNMDQVRQYNPPPNPAKLSDSRAKDYIANYGRKSWELDALEPKAIEELIRENIVEEIDWDLWEARVELQNEGRDKIREVAKKL